MKHVKVEYTRQVNVCKLFQMEQETQYHVLFCNSKEMKKQKLNYCKKLIDDLSTIKTYPYITGMTYLIVQTGMIPRYMIKEDPYLIETISEQQCIGFLKFLLGFWTTG